MRDRSFKSNIKTSKGQAPFIAISSMFSADDSSLMIFALTK